FLVVDGEWEEVLAGLGRFSADYRGEYNGIANVDDYCAGRLAGDAAGFHYNGVIAITKFFTDRIKHVFFPGANKPGQPNASQAEGMSSVLAAQAKSLNELVVAVGVLSLQVVEQFAAGVDHADQATTGVVIVLMVFEVILQLVDVAGEQGYLYFRRASVPFGQAVFTDDVRFLRGS